MKRGMTRKDKGTLFCYASGDGALHFCWNSKNDNGQWEANGTPVTKADARAYLKLQEAKHLRERGWRVCRINSQWVLIADVRRVGEDTLTYHGPEIGRTSKKGRKYTYTIEGDDPVLSWTPQPLYHRLTVFGKSRRRGAPPEVREVENLSVRAAIAHYLAHEDTILKYGLTNDRDFVLPKHNHLSTEVKAAMVAKTIV